MSKVVIQGDTNGTGVFTLASPNSNTDRTLTLPDSAGTMMLTDTGVTTAQMPAGSVIQVAQSDQDIARFSSTSTSFVASGFYLDFTPKLSSSKVLIGFEVTALSTSQYVYLTLYRDGTELGNNNGNGMAYAGAVGNWDNAAYSILDTPNTTSQVRYEIYGRTGGSANTWYIGNESGTGTDSKVRITAMEIAQ